MQAIQARLTTLLENDTVLAEPLHAYRLILAQQRAAMQQGQKALAGYGSLATTLSPKYVSTSG